MGKIVYRTFPRLFTLSTSLFGSIFFALIDYLIWKDSNNNPSLIIVILFIFFLILSFVSFYFFITLRILNLTDAGIQIAYFFFPVKKIFLFSEIKTISQKVSEVDNSNSRGSYSYTTITTTIDFHNGKKIKISTLSQSDYQEILKGFYKLKGGGYYMPSKKNFILYLLENISDIIWTIFFLIITIGLSHALFSLFSSYLDFSRTCVSWPTTKHSQ